MYTTCLPVNMTKCGGRLAGNVAAVYMNIMAFFKFALLLGCVL